jgi:zinc transporter ZupT
LLVSHSEADEWLHRASDRLRDDAQRATPDEIRRAAREAENPVLGVWLGNLLDGIPESLVLGASVTGWGAISWPLFAGIFLDNVPESMSSSRIMHTAGMSRRKIFIMWWAVVLMSGVMAALGNLFLAHASGPTYGIIEGTAAGAMLVMIAETTLPEAYERGGAIVGLATLAGFLVELGIKKIS